MFMMLETVTWNMKLAGMRQVFVNGVQVLKDGEHTGAKPGRALWGAGRVK